jgi:mannosyl-oligosaccharide alpha-1,2-mannosidase
VTAIDSIDTMILMGLTDEYEQVRRHVANTDFTRPIDIDRDALIFFFETIIRYLGGMLSAYHLSNDAVFLTAADDLAKTLLPAFDTPSGLPATIVKFRRGKGVPSEAYLGSRVYLAEIGTCQLEYKYLARLTRRIAYFTKVQTLLMLFKPWFTH